jgi:hypothetical protein
VIETNCVVATATSKAQKELDIEVPPAWTNDWTAFVKELKKEIKKDNYYVNNVNIAFLGKSVVWTGTVKEIRRPPNERPFPSVDLSMKSEDLGFASGKTTLDSLSLQPEGDEWNTWQNVSVGDKVVFRTTLDVFPYVSPKCVFSLMVGVGSGAGTNIAWISAKGGVCLKSEPSRKQ